MNRSIRVLSVLLVLFILLILGTVGYRVIENMSLLDALYMTVITISTVGFSEVASLSPAGRWFTIFFIMASLGTVAYAFTSIASFLLEGEFNKVLRRRRMEGRVANLKDHIILCGYGQTGQMVAEQFRKRKVPFLVIEKEEDKVSALQQEGVLALQGDATVEELLHKARIEHSRGLVACLSTDAENVFTVLTAREINQELYIVARAIERNAHGKLRKAGANNTISPNELGGMRMAGLVLKPAVVSFIDVINRVGDVDFDIEEVEIGKNSPFAGKTLRETQIKETTGFIVLALQRDGNFIINPGVNQQITTGDRLIVLGENDKIAHLRALSKGSIFTKG